MRSGWNAERRIRVYSLADEVRMRMGNSAAELSDDEVLSMCFEAVRACGAGMCMDMAERAAAARKVFCALRCELEVLQDISDDPEVSEIMVNGPDSVFAERCGRMERLDISFESGERLERVIQRLAAGVGREMSELNPIVDARLSDGSRINAVHERLAIGGPVLTVRKFNRSRISLEDITAQGDMDEAVASALKSYVLCGYNIFVSGGTSSGKTTLLNVLSDFIPKSERLVVIEDSAELQLRGHENMVRMEARSANAQGKGAVSIRDLIRASLRMRPDRIIVGEVRGGEVADMLAAMSTGHDGSLSTGHANSVKGMLSRLETMHISASGFPLQAVRSQIAEAIDIFVHMERTPDGRRRVVEISELCGVENGEYVLNTLFAWDAESRKVVARDPLVKDRKLRMFAGGEAGYAL